MPINNCTAEQSEYLFRVSGSKVTSQQQQQQQQQQTSQHFIVSAVRACKQSFSKKSVVVTLQLCRWYLRDKVSQLFFYLFANGLPVRKMFEKVVLNVQ
jgi:ribosomal protein S14